MGEIRDFTAATVESFETFIDSYFDSQTGKIKSFWARVWRKISGLFESSTADYDGDSEKYIRSLSAERTNAESKVVETWLAVANVEQTYIGKFSASYSDCVSLKNMVNTIANSVSVKKFHAPCSFDSLLLACSDDYLNIIDSKIDTILEKDCSDWTDGEIEILAYVYVHSDDNAVRQRIISALYSDASDEHLLYPNGKPDDPYYRYYERNEQVWIKLKTCGEYYYAQHMSAYYDGTETDEEFNQQINRYRTLLYFDTYPALVTEGDTPPISWEDGQIVLFAPTREITTVWNNNSSKPVSLPGAQTETVLNQFSERSTFDSNVHIANGGDAAKEIRNDVSFALYKEERLSWSTIKDYGIKIISSVADKTVPGTGKLIKSADKYIEKTISAVEKASEFSEEQNRDYTVYTADHEKSDLAWFVDYFEIKVISVDSGYVLMPSQETAGKYDSFMTWLQEKNPSLYSKYAPTTCTSGSESGDFVNTVNPVDLCNDLYGAGILDDLKL